MCRLIISIVCFLSCIGCRETSVDITLASESKPGNAEVVRRLLGLWLTENNEKMNIPIDKDSIFFPERFTAYYYTTKEDSIFIQYDDNLYKARVRVNGDTLFMNVEDSITRFIRVE
jgi:hypothetical protein